jgi:trehalose-6-phosphate hydrolase
MVVANLSRERQQWQPDPVQGAWRVALGNYDDVPSPQCAAIAPV